MSHLTLDNHPAYQDFLHWVRKTCQTGTIDPASKNKPRLLPAHALQDYFRANQYYNLNKLLRAVFREEEVPVDADKVAEKCPKVFCILLLIGKPEYIERFVQRDGLHDPHLPFNTTHRPEQFPICTQDQNSEEFLRRFCDQQWMVCAPEIDFQVDREFQDDRTLPFTVTEKLGGGGSAILYKIEISPTYNRLHTLNGAPQVPDNLFANTFALKTYFGANAERYYKCEVNAFRRLRGRAQNMIGFYGSFRQRNLYHVLLEFADIGTLEEYFEKTSPPTAGEDIINFWERMFMLIEALLYIHEGEIMDSSDGFPQPLQGWHQDVKPANILVSTLGETIESPYDYRIKLGDLGTSHFKKMNSLDEENTDQDSQGTSTYGAPECCRTDDVLRKSKLNVTPTVDVWSLGGVFSEAAVWLVESYQSVKRYRHDRQIAPKNIPGVHDCFHDGEKALSVVRQWHKHLERSLRKDDVLTSKVLVMIDLMFGDEKSRPKTKTFWAMSQRMLGDAKEELRERRLLNDPLTPTKTRPPPSLISSQSTSPALSRRDTTSEYNGRFGEMARMLSPPPVDNSEDHDQVEIGNQLGNVELQRNGSMLTTSRYPYPNGQSRTRSGTAQDFTTSNFNPSMGARAQSHDIQLHQQMHHVTSSMSGLNVHNENELNQNAQGWAPPRRPTLSNAPFDESSYTPLRHEATEPIWGAPRHGLDHSPHHSYPETNLNQNWNTSGHHVQEPFVPNRTSPWPQENSSLQQPNVLSMNYAAQNADGDMPTMRGNYNQHPQGRSGVSSPPPQQVYYASDAGMGVAGNAHQDSAFTPQPQPGSFPPQEMTTNLLEATSSTASKAKYKPPAVLQVGTAISLLNRQVKPEALQGYHLFPRLKQRDHVFLLDDALSMSPHWNDVETVFSVLAKIVNCADRDGIDLKFTMSEETYNSKSTWGLKWGSRLSRFLGHVQNHRQKLGGTSNITYALDDILLPYQKKLATAFNLKRGSRVRPLNLYVLTDGIWEPGCDPSSTIMKLVEKLAEFEYPKDSKQIGIQFVYFGKDDEALKKLNDLDDNLGQQMDIVDATPSNGNVWKMLLGAIDKTFDES